MKTVLAGACLAAMSGLLMGGALKPNLRADDRAEGPQIIAGVGRIHAASGPFDDDATYGLAAYHGTPPDYVFGTDMKRAVTWLPQTAEPPREAPPTVEVAQADDVTTQAIPSAQADDDSDPAGGPLPVSYPSLDGGAPAQGMDLIPPPSDDGAG